MRHASPVLVTLAALASGCLPVMPHPTRVEPAFHMGMHAGFVVFSDSTTSRGRGTGGIPFVDTEFALGLRDPSREDLPGFRVSLMAGLSGYAGSLYMELPRPFLGDIDTGLGAFLHRGRYRNLGAYFQFGHNSASDLAWYVRNAIVLSENHGVTRTVWMPTLGVTVDRGTQITQLYLAAAIGQQPPICTWFSCAETTYRQQTNFVVGVSMSRQLQTPPYGELPPRE